MLLPKITETDVSSKKVLIRADLDLSEGDEYRLNSSVETLKFLLEKNAKIIIISHKGRPGGNPSKELSLEETAKKLSALLGHPIKFVFDIAGEEAREEAENLKNGEIICLENLRFDSREESNDESFAKSLALLGEIYVNEAFASSHREHASIAGIPKFLPHFAGIHFAKEIENLSKAVENPARPLLVYLSGIKRDKLEMIKPLSEIADKVLVGGRLPEYLGDEALESVRLQGDDKKVLIGNLIMDKEDVTLNTIERWIKEAGKAKTIVLAGVMGKYEEEGHSQGTKRVFEAIAETDAFKIVGGGDSLAAVSKYNLDSKFDWISTGGGAMIEYISKRTLPGIEALLH